MPRVARVVVPDVSLHIVQRGHDRAPCFFDEDDYVAYLVALGTYAARFGCAVHAYCLMTNHVHLLVTPSDHHGCALLMKHLAQGHSRRINSRRGRSGSLWEGRFHSGLVASDEYAIACYRYIELNPLRACMVDHPGRYRWSSYSANVGAEPDGFVQPHATFLALGLDPLHRISAYRELCDTPLAQPLIDEIRRATRSGHRMGEPCKPRGPGPKRSVATENQNGDCHQLEMVTVTN
jgi:putative transposase